MKLQTMVAMIMTGTLIADPQSRTAELYLNGKLVPQKLAFEKPGESLRFAGNLGVDDLLVYPWREGTAYAGWDYVYPYSDKRKPLLGWYDEGHPEETDWEIKWQVEHGIVHGFVSKGLIHSHKQGKEHAYCM